MRRSVEDYRGIVSDEVISEIYSRERRLYGRSLLHINSTYHGGGVAEILNSLVPLMNDVGLAADWRILHGTPDFFNITKKFHNALQGDSLNLTEMKKRLYVQANEDFATFCHIDGDCVVVHDPQPLPLIKFFKKRQPWVWRCHVDLSNLNWQLWEFLKKFILRYDVVIVSKEEFVRQDLPVRQRVIPPAIDPLSPKNAEIPETTVLKYMRKFGVPLDKPLITQVSRFDKWKDPEGVIEVFKLVKKEVDCRLVLCGSMAPDDPEGQQIFQRVVRKAGQLMKKGDVLLVTSENNIFVNALQRKSAIVIQKSIREGFGLSITEALWKGKPVVASSVGGIPLQIKDGENGFLLDPHDNEGFAERIVRLLQNPELSAELGRNARETIREKFLITRLLKDHLDLLQEILCGSV